MDKDGEIFEKYLNKMKNAAEEKRQKRKEREERERNNVPKPIGDYRFSE